MLKYLVLILISLFASPAVLGGEEQAKSPDVTKTQWEKLQNGEMVVSTEQSDERTWPDVTVYVLLKSPPKESMAIFSHFEHQKNYVPGVLESTVVKVKSPREVHTKYEMDMPWPMGNSHYIHGTVISPPEGERYHINWYDVRSDSAEKVRGAASFLPLKTSQNGGGKYQSLMVYESRVVPKSAFAGLFRGIMVEDVKESMLATRKEIHEVWKKRLPVLKTAVEILEKSLSGENPYADSSTPDK